MLLLVTGAAATLPTASPIPLRLRYEKEFYKDIKNGIYPPKQWSEASYRTRPGSLIPFHPYGPDLSIHPAPHLQKKGSGLLMFPLANQEHLVPAVIGAEEMKANAEEWARLGLGIEKWAPDDLNSVKARFTEAVALVQSEVEARGEAAFLDQLSVEETPPPANGGKKRKLGDDSDVKDVNMHGAAGNIRLTAEGLRVDANRRMLRASASPQLNVLAKAIFGQVAAKMPGESGFQKFEDDHQRYCTENASAILTRPHAYRQAFHTDTWRSDPPPPAAPPPPHPSPPPRRAPGAGDLSLSLYPLPSSLPRPLSLAPLSPLSPPNPPSLPTTHRGNHLHVLPRSEWDLSALVAVEKDFEIIVLKHSLELIERVNELWTEFSSVEGISSVPVKLHAEDGEYPPNPAAYFDYVGWKQLEAEGWGSTKKLEPVKIKVPKGHFLWFRTWLIHAGAEFNPSLDDGGIRLHYYLLNYIREGPPTSINMQASQPQVRGGARGRGIE